LTVRRAYSSPYHLFTSIPPAPNYIGLPKYWEDDPDSPHLYGYAVDINVSDWTEPEGLQDDWEELSAIMVAHGLITSNPAGDWTYVHAKVEYAQESLITINIDPPSVMPGREIPLPVIVRQFNISGQVSGALAPYIDGQLILRVNEVPYSGGHLHPNRPMIHDPVPNVVTGEELQGDGGLYQVTYADTCEWGGQFQVSAHFIKTGVVHYSTRTIDIRVNDLVELGKDPAYDLLGDYAQHRRNHYVRDDHDDQVLDIVQRFYFLADSLHPGDPIPRIWINDMCLSWGGRFDVGPTILHHEWPLWGYPHREHRIGSCMDIGFHGINRNHSHYFILRDAITYVIGTAPLGEGNHWHARFFEYTWE
jgi:hypothetical protein